jgi:hypothetical protein
MQFPHVSSVLAFSAVAALTLSFAPRQGDESAQMAEMMKKAAAFTQPGENHKVLEKFVGKWNTEMRFFNRGKAGPPEKGSAEFSWLMPGRWLQTRAKGSMGGQQAEFFYLMGYDNFKMSFVTTTISSLDTAMLHYEGDMTPDGKALISYGTLDEYLTGEHDKMVKTVWRFVDADTILLEVHDLPIGEVDTKVFEIKYTRAK